MELNKVTAKLGHITSTTLFILSLLPSFNIYLQEGKSFASSPQAISHTLVCVESCSQDYLNVLGINPLSPNIHIQILQTNLHTFPLRMS